MKTMMINEDSGGKHGLQMSKLNTKRINCRNEKREKWTNGSKGRRAERKDTGRKSSWIRGR